MATLRMGLKLKPYTLSQKSILSCLLSHTHIAGCACMSINTLMNLCSCLIGKCPKHHLCSWVGLDTLNNCNN